jgi:hypothetical protein
MRKNFGVRGSEEKAHNMAFLRADLIKGERENITRDSLDA